MTQEWDDQTVIALGAAYMANEQTTIRFGYNHSDNPVPDEEDVSQKQLRAAYSACLAARAGLISCRNALEYVLKEIPEVDPGRIYTAGSGSGGTRKNSVTVIPASPSVWVARA